MMFIVISEETEPFITMLNPGFEHSLIPLDHLIVAVCLVDDMTKTAGRGHGSLLGQPAIATVLARLTISDRAVCGWNSCIAADPRRDDRSGPWLRENADVLRHLVEPQVACPNKILPKPEGVAPAEQVGLQSPPRRRQVHREKTPTLILQKEETVHTPTP